MIIAIDFDGTCVTHEYPRIGKDIGAVPYLKELAKRGHKLILYTMRDRGELVQAEKWFKDNGIPLYGVNKNPNQNWTTSPKVYAHKYIDDAAVGVPLMYDGNLSDRPFVDWCELWKLLNYNTRDCDLWKTKT